MSELRELIGKDLEPSDWLEVSQERIDAFADATGDHQWIHVDPVRAAEGPFGTTIAHGFLTLSLCAPLLLQALKGLTASGMSINYGTNKVRFPAPVPVGIADPRAGHRRIGGRRPRGRADGRRRHDRARRWRQAGMRRRARDQEVRMTVADRFTGQVALITGGARGIGAATAARLAAEGADVVIADFDLAAAEETAAAIGGRAVQCDVTSREQVEAAVAAAAAPTGRLDILVTCAGIIRDNLLHKMTDDDWDAVINTHLRGTFLAVQAAQKLMVAQQSGSMVLISSTSALGNRGQANYSAAKAGLQGLAKTLSIELGRFGIIVNCVAPGFIATAMTEQTAARLGMSFEEFMELGAGQVPLQRIGVPDDVAGVIAFLCSKDASYVSGQVIYVRGGP